MTKNREMAETRPLVTISRGPCLGTCPVYSAEIYSDGTVVYVGEMFVEVVGVRRHRISEAKVRELIRAFEKADYFSLKSVYTAEITCLPTTVTSFEWEGRRKSVKNYFGAPRKLERLENAIDRIAGLKELIGDQEWAG
ncbi:MAG TPA: DUF6438 domain-containing protein [Pyrinomonadaceae bacterium]|nr:DUF6438 domain-containing protein [Pyrinomonadaceae bacterium]HMP65997.1 DUF6438 domain-containing protein [Pyrinomonadaceae bacterium]